MFLLIVIVILVVATGILGNIYLGVFSFQQNYGDLENYKNSYYAAVSSLERGLLVAKYKEPGFVGSGGFIGTGSRGELSDTFSGDFGKYTKSNNGLSRELNSRTQEIKGDINYNKAFLLHKDIDNSNNHYEETADGDVVYFYNEEANYISGYIYKDDIFNDIIGNNLIRITKISNNKYGGPIGDNKINANDININKLISFDKETNNIHTIEVGITFTGGDGFYIFSGMSLSPGGININYTGDGAFDEIIKDSNGTSFYISGNIKDIDNQRLPNLKYYFESNTGFADIYYYIDGQGTIGKYQQNLSIKKPTSNIKNPNRKNFIFPYYE